jgi:hypothetical protein
MIDFLRHFRPFAIGRLWFAGCCSGCGGFLPVASSHAQPHPPPSPPLPLLSGAVGGIDKHKKYTIFVEIKLIY